MKSLNYFVIILFTFTLLLVSTAIPQSKLELPNDLNIELLGRCGLYSFSYERLVSENFGIEAGVSIFGISEESIVFFSGGGRLYLLKGNASPCISGGIVVVTQPTDSGPFSNDDSLSFGYAGPGFEYRSSGGFLFRGTVYFLIKDGFLVWPGLQFGIAF